MVSYRFPQKFPDFLQGFLNSMRELTPRIQETFKAKPASILSVKGFLGGKLFHGQETFGFLEGFLGGGVSSRLQVTSIWL